MPERSEPDSSSAVAVVVPVRFGRGELNAFLNCGARPPTPDDRTFLVGGGDRPATPEELRAFAERLWAVHRAEENAG